MSAGPPRIIIRPARRDDAPALAALDHEVWDPSGSPAERPAPDADPFAGTELESVLVAAGSGDVPVGYVVLSRATRLASHSHIREIRGLGVAIAWRGQGVGRALLQAALEAAAATGARRIRLRVLATNRPALALYAAAGFVTDVVLPDEFRIGDRYVDDVVMSYSLSSST